MRAAAKELLRATYVQGLTAGSSDRNFYDKLTQPRKRKAVEKRVKLHLQRYVEIHEFSLETAILRFPVRSYFPM